MTSGFLAEGVGKELDVVLNAISRALSSRGLPVRLDRAWFSISESVIFGYTQDGGAT
jgi:hypothetical protein